MALGVVDRGVTGLLTGADFRGTSRRACDEAVGLSRLHDTKTLGLILGDLGFTN